MTDALLSAREIVWGIPTLAMILGIGLLISICTGFAQVLLFPAAVRSFFRKSSERAGGEGTSPFRALCTALAATVGTGNIVGVAGAICLGGPGAIFWMWICGLLGMGIKFAEVTLALRFRTASGVGGPMYIIANGMNYRWRWLAGVYCLFGVAASFGVGNATQINAVLSGINHVFQLFGRGESLRRDLGIGLILAVLLGSVLLGGARRIGAAAELLVPAVSAVYVMLCVGVLVFRFSGIAEAFSAIIQGAFSPEAVTGGVTGSLFRTIQIGCSRGVFTNEAGMGTASIAHASADAAHPVEQGLYGILEVFLDTIVMCTLTALAILVSRVPVSYGVDSGGSLTAAVFSDVLGEWASIVLVACLCCFAFATVLGWGLYGARCAQFLWGRGAWMPFALAQTVAVVLGSTLKTENVWLFSEVLNGLMAIPNLIVLAAMLPELTRLTKEYKNRIGSNAAKGGNYADFYQCKPLRTFSHAKIPPLCHGGRKGR